MARGWQWWTWDVKSPDDHMSTVFWWYHATAFFRRHCVCLCLIPSHLIPLLSSAHSKFTKLDKTVFPNGIDAYLPSSPPMLSPISCQSSIIGLVSRSFASSASFTSILSAIFKPDLKPPISQKQSLFGCLALGSNASIGVDSNPLSSTSPSKKAWLGS